MNFSISERTRISVEHITGRTYDDLKSMPLSEEGKKHPNDFSPFRDQDAREIPSRGSVYLQLQKIAKLKDISRRFFKF